MEYRSKGLVDSSAEFGLGELMALKGYLIRRPHPLVQLPLENYAGGVHPAFGKAWRYTLPTIRVLQSTRKFWQYS